MFAGRTWIPLGAAGLLGAAAAFALYPGEGTGQQLPIDPNAAYPCCDMQSGEIVGEMTIAECAARARHVPKIPGMPDSGQFCPAPDQGGGGGGGGGGPSEPPPPVGTFEDEPVWEDDAFKDNLPNGSFERWAGYRPIGFGSYRRAEQVRDFPPELRDFETVFRASESFEGGSAIEIRNFHLDLSARLAGKQIPAQVREMLENIALPGGTLTCQENCPVGQTDTGASGRELRVAIEGAGPAICGVYKDNLLGGDLLMASVSLFDGGQQPIAGATAMDIRSAKRSRDRDGWIKFRLPIDRLPGNEYVQATEATLQFQIVPGGFGGSSFGSVNVGSRAAIDAVHFCGGLDLQITDAMSSGGYIVPESFEDKGAIAWVNLDNDDNDKQFDDQDDDVQGGDNEFAQLLLQLPSGSRGEITLHQRGGSGKTRIWTGRTRAPGEAWPNLNQPKKLEEAGFTDNGAFLEKVLWVEGLHPSEATSDIVFELEFLPDGARESEKDTVALTVLAVENLVWHGKRGNSEHDSNELGIDINHPLNEGAAMSPAPSGNPYDRPLRVFPGKRYKGGAATNELLDTVDLEVVLNVAPPRKTDVYLKVFDLDDPSADDDEVDDESAAEDNRGKKRSVDKVERGVFTEKNRPGLALEVEEKETKTEFLLTMQPGDNFRVAAFGDKDFIAKLENDDVKLGGKWEDGARIVHSDMLAAGMKPEEAEVQQPESYLSDTLTVWRFLHVEMDSMKPTEGQVLSGSITNVVRAPEYESGPGNFVEAWHVMTDLDIVAKKWPNSRGVDGIRNSFFRGQLRVGGTNYVVTGNSAKRAPVDSVTIVTELTEEERQALIGKSFELVDDDYVAIPISGSAGQAGPYEDGVPIPLPPDDRLRDTEDNPYLEAYVMPRLDTIPSGPGTREFVGNIEIDNAEHIKTYFDQFDMRDNEADPDLWTVYLLGAFQGVHWEDGDGQLGIGGAWIGAIAGETDGLNGEGGLIYWGSGSELEKGHGSAEGWRLIDATVHEIGHMFSLVHEDGDLMSDGNYGPPSRFFSPRSLDKIRSIEHP